MLTTCRQNLGFSPMKSKVFCFIVMFTLVMVQPWNLEFAVSIWCL